MQTANPNDLSTHAVPVLAAQLSEAELARWIPISFKEISDPDEVPEPTKGALVRLLSGAYAVLSYGLISKQLTIRLAEGANFNRQLESFFDEVPTLISRVIWLLPNVSLPKQVGMSSRPMVEERAPSRSAAAPRFKLAAKTPTGSRKAARAGTSPARRTAVASGSRVSAKKGSSARKATKVMSSSKPGSAGKSRKAGGSRVAKAHSRASGSVSKKK